MNRKTAMKIILKFAEEGTQVDKDLFDIMPPENQKAMLKQQKELTEALEIMRQEKFTREDKKLMKLLRKVDLAKEFNQLKSSFHFFRTKTFIEESNSVWKAIHDLEDRVNELEK